ncbi:hypothetical protein [Afipia birgiae]|uniref:hypothetical protein n=1 Tax=Afipia birgiae TaxID=151414 RepID=UPI0003022990|nr:hypothetical protein [Afipia birgiae]
MRSELQHLVKNWSFDIPFERSVRAHYLALQQLETSGLTWVTIAAALTQAGARHKNGRPISARQMNSVFLRIRKAHLTNLAGAACLEIAPRARSIEDKSERPTHQTQVKSAGETIEIATAAIAASPQSAVTGLAQRLAEARRLREATRIEYDD